ncbi:MAG: hypothetical protein HOM14_17675 [Gammaproteobacteria bacterium]|jgi:hypothetical protein|nr:hypothetical protein [Gammaproteobacteria bacterium]MBT3725113.1 hypothetical protein [Gammaproteobacteria bacterium]MBT4078861.1 hypothetical protein [Gammaproteobacteria bacterium]MBT4194175.1 hypothetical protein [Gammaproteobacteria bacterium]MBT4448488.1 hypothetical protein [Gammaproteobacteria bacterium]
MKPFKFLLFFQIGILSTYADALQFTANAVMSTPNRADVSTYLFYSTGRIRKEFFYYGEPVIQILDANKHISLMCFTEQTVCYENKTLEEINIGIEGTMTSPCDKNSTLNCENEGVVEINNRQAVKWKIIAKEGEKEKVSHLWLDTELNIPVKQTLSNGTVMELKWLGVEKLNNRETDKWIHHIKLANGDTQQSFQWFDKELKISIRETFPNGNSQELQNIVVQDLQDKLFTMPVGYEIKSMSNSLGQTKSTSNK